MSRTIDHKSERFGVHADPPPSLTQRAGWVLRPLASLKLTVVLFTLCLVLVLCGTLAQVDNSIEWVVGNYFRSMRVVWIPFQIFIPRSVLNVAEYLPGWLQKFPYPGGWLLGAALLTNLLAAHAVRFRLRWNRIGILLLHSGVLVLLLGELVTGLFQVEAKMEIRNGSSSNFVQLGEVELAIIDPANPHTDNVVVIPESILQSGTPRPSGDAHEGAGVLIQHPELPVDVVVDHFMPNSEVAKPRSGDANPATAGDGLFTVAVEEPRVAGADAEQREDMASAYVTFKKKGTGQSLGTYLVSQWLTRQAPPLAQTLKVDGKAYDVFLRFKRVYKPYTVQLLKFTHDIYVGTDVPKDFASQIRLIDLRFGEDRELKIWMNHPLKHAGETLYQGGFIPGDLGTVLQVVRNPGWLLPYVACFMVALGLLRHFGIMLLRFLGMDMVDAIWSVFAIQAIGIIPALVLIIWFNTYAAVGATMILLLVPLALADLNQLRRQQRGPVAKSAASEPDMNMLERLLPALTVAVVAAYLIFAMIPQRDSAAAMQLRDFGRIPVVHKGRVKPLDTLARVSLMIISGKQTYYDDRGVEHPAIEWLLDVMTGDPGRDDGPSTQQKVFRIENDQLLGMLDVKERPGFRYSFNEIRAKLPTVQKPLEAANAKKEADRDAFDTHVISLAGKVELFLELANLEIPHMVPPQKTGGEWQKLRDSAQQAQVAGQPQMKSDTVRLAMLLREYQLRNADSFNNILADYRGSLAPRFPAEVRRANVEVLFNHFAPFYQCSILYVLAFVLAACGWLGWSRPLWRTAFWLLALTLLVHSMALIARMYIQGRPPVTNLYSSAIFIGWAAVIFGLGLEVIYRNGIGTTLAAVIGAVTLWIAHNLGSDGDTMEMMRAVLDTNFWLATHVVVVTLGYTATFFAGSLGIAFIGLGVFTEILDKDTVKRVGSMIYGVLCFAMLFSFVGTVLGGIWADQSWGRFWGWDPKENGAVLIVIWNALVLHARFSGMVRQRGMATLAVFGNIVTSWSWFGVNMLGVGLHSYGRMGAAPYWLGGYMLSQLLIIAIGLLPTRMWLSYIAENDKPTVVPSQPGRNVRPEPVVQT